MTQAGGGVLETVFRDNGARVLAALASRFRNLDLAEEAFADACAAALAAWPEQPPRDPASWLYAVAARRAVDRLRRSRSGPDPGVDPESELTPEQHLLVQEPIPDERLRLIFVCCHPALALDARAALTLKVVGGLSVERLARAFLTSEPTLAQRLVRAKRKIREAGVSFEVPGRALWPERLEAVLATLEIAYTQAYEDAALAGEGAEFGLEVMRLSTVLCELLPDEPEVLALTALVRFTEARRRARLDERGAMVPLTQQDVPLWDRSMIVEAEALLARAARLKGPGPYQLMAAIHAAHASRLRTQRTPWPAILRLYEALLSYRPTPVTEVNRAVALAEVAGHEAGMAALDAINRDNRLDGWLPYQAAKGELLARAGRQAETGEAFTLALSLDPPPAERLYFLGRVSTV